jgi:D-3-phosphoglycerate dehydrogenase
MRRTWRMTRRSSAPALARVRGMVLPPSVAVDRAVLRAAPQLLTVGRLSAGAENLDLDACARAGVEVVRPATASANAEAEFAIGALLQMLRRVPVINAEGLAVGRELGGSVVGIVGMTPAARPLATLLDTFGAGSSATTPRCMRRRRPVGPLGRRAGAAAPADGAQRRRVRAAELLLALPRPAGAALPGRMQAQPGAGEPGAVGPVRRSRRWPMRWPRGAWPRPGSTAWSPARWTRAGRCTASTTLQVTPRVASTTRESRIRSAWAVAQRMDEILRRAAALATSRRRHQAR